MVSGHKDLREREPARPFSTLDRRTHARRHHQRVLSQTSATIAEANEPAMLKPEYYIAKLKADYYRGR